MPSVYDSKAIKILCSTYWNSSGWKNEDERHTSQDDFDYTLAQGVMFHPVECAHDDVAQKLNEVVARIPPQAVGKAFLHSLSSRDLAYRSALGSYAAAAWMPAHTYAGPLACKICGQYESRGKLTDLNVLNFERLKWGGVRHTSIVYQLLDLTEFEKLPGVQPTDQDYETFRSILTAASSLPGHVWCRELEKAIAGLFPSSKHEREVLLNILSYCGIIAPQDRPGFFRQWPTFATREHRPASKLDWPYPIMWWQGKDDINTAAVDFYFPSFRLDSDPA